MLGFIANEPWRSSALPNVRSLRSRQVGQCSRDWKWVYYWRGPQGNQTRVACIWDSISSKPSRSGDEVNREKGVPYSRHYRYPVGSLWKWLETELPMACQWVMSVHMPSLSLGKLLWRDKGAVIGGLSQMRAIRPNWREAELLKQGMEEVNCWSVLNTGSTALVERTGVEWLGRCTSIKSVRSLSTSQ